MNASVQARAVAGRQIRLYIPAREEIVEAVDGKQDGPGDAELHTWAIPWDSGLFVQMASWDLSALAVMDLGCGLGLAGSFAMQQQAKGK